MARPQLFALLRRLASTTSMPPPTLVDAAESLYSIPSVLTNWKSETVPLQAVYQDTLPSGSSVGTVVALHGSPGTHRDFKYIVPHLKEKGIRFVGFNYPGYGLTEDVDEMKHRNAERNSFTDELLSRLSLAGPLLFLGHSRGAENALHAANTHQCIGAILVTPFGLRPNKGVRPFFQFSVYTKLYEYRFLRPIIHQLMVYMYRYWIGLRIRDGREGIVSIHAIGSIDLQAQVPHIDAIGRHGEKLVLIPYAGKDFLIETDVSREYVEKFNNRHHIHLATKDEKEEQEAVDAVKKAYSSGHRVVSAEFAPDRHHMQKDRAKFIADSIAIMFEQANQKSLKSKA